MSAIIVSPSSSSQYGAANHAYPQPKSGSQGITITSSPRDGAGESAPLLRSEPTKRLLSKPHFVAILLGVWSANFAIAFQAMAVPTMTPAVGSSFGRAELGSYLGSAFSLGNAAVIPLYGVLMETLGRKFAMNTACTVFALGTVSCALSTSMYMLIASRALAGLGGGGMLTVSSVIVTDLVPLRDRGMYQGWMMTVFAAGSLLGGPTAGWLIDTYGWPLSFWVQLPIALFCILMVSLLLPPSPIPPTHKTIWSGLASLDWLGSALLIGSVTTLILGFSFHTSFLLPWGDGRVWGNLVAAGVAFIALLVTESKVSRPVVPLGLFRSRHVAGCMASGFFLSVVSQAFMYQIPMYFAVILDTSNAHAGIILSLSSSFGQCVGSLWAGQHIRRGGAYRLMGILALLPPILGAFAASLWTPGWSTLAYYATCMPPIFGYSVFLCVQLVALVGAVDSQAMPKATALLYTLRTLGGTLGIAIGGSVQIGVLAGELKKLLPNTDDKTSIINAVLHSKNAIRLLPPDLRDVALHAYAHSLTYVWIGCGLVGMITLASACLIQEKEMGPVKPKRRKSKGTGGAVMGVVPPDGMA